MAGRPACPGSFLLFMVDEAATAEGSNACVLVPSCPCPTSSLFLRVCWCATQLSQMPFGRNSQNACGGEKMPVGRVSFLLTYIYAWQKLL